MATYYQKFNYAAPGGYQYFLWNHGRAEHKQPQQLLADASQITGILAIENDGLEHDLSIFENLQVLEVASHHLPDCSALTQLPNLERLIIYLEEKTQLDFLTTLHLPTQIKHLKIHTSHSAYWPKNSALDTFPTQILALKNLTTLTIIGGQFTQLPAGLGQLPLTSLNLSGATQLDMQTAITTLTDGGRAPICHTLQTLACNYTGGETVGSHIRHFTRLENFWFEGSNMQSFQPELGQFELQSIAIEDTPFATHSGHKDRSMMAYFKRLEQLDWNTEQRCLNTAAFVKNTIYLDALPIHALVPIVNCGDKKTADAVLAYLQSRTLAETELSQLPTNANIGLLGGLSGYTKAEIKTTIKQLGYQFTAQPADAQFVIIGNKSVKDIAPVLEQDPIWISFTPLANAAQPAVNPVTDDDPQLEAKIRGLLYSHDISNLTLAVKMMEHGIPDDLIYDVVCMYLNNTKTDDWCEEGRRRPLSRIVKKCVPNDILNAIEPFTKKNSATQKTIALAAVLLHNDIDAPAMMAAIGRNHFFHETFFKYHDSDDNEENFFYAMARGGVPENLKYHALFIWCDTRHKHKKWAEDAVKANWRHLAAHFSDALLVESYRTYTTIYQHPLGMVVQPDIAPQQWLDTFLRLEWHHSKVGIPCDDFPQKWLDYYQEHLQDWVFEVEIVQQFSPTLYADIEACEAIQTLFQAKRLNRSDHKYHDSMMPDFLQGFSAT